ncbi:MAG: anthranilate synthase component I [Pseudomonadales bacterium]|nr:anthranilate synthase component I [Pseudomonadales bacterium]
MSSEQFQAFVDQGFNRIPVMREVLADLDTPLSTYLKLANGPYSYLFESVEGGEKWGRYSIIGLPCRTILKVYGYKVLIEKDGKVVEERQVEDPLAFVEQYQSEFRVPELEILPRFTGGLVGYFAYDIVKYIEKRLKGRDKLDPIGSPDILLMLSEDVVVFDNLRGSLFVITHANPAENEALTKANARLEELVSLLQSPAPNVLPVIDGREAVGGREVKESDFVSGLTQAGYEGAVDTIKEYILAGDVMQVVPSQRMSIPYSEPPLNLYRALRYLNPSPYMYHMNLGDFHVVGSSPEILTRVEQGVVTVRPIAGTRKRGETAEKDLALERELVSDPKEIAEHLMLIDLGRNDVGRVAKVGEVHLTQKMAVERYSHVMHIVSNVEGKLKEGLTAIDVLRATFPAGTLSGAPKIRAMEIIDELEPVKRGVYGGAIGYLTWQGDMDTAIAIRTAVIKDEVLHIQAGGGIVADSVPLMEWKETMNKGRAIFKAVAMSVNGLPLSGSTGKGRS